MMRPQSITKVMGLVGTVLLCAAVAFAEPASSETEHESHHPGTQSQATAGQSGAGAGMGMMGGQGMMGGPGRPGVMGPGMMGGPCGMMDMQMMSDPKTRGQMMEIHGRMMKEMGALMEKRGQQLEQSN
jgi:hypothetical protein